MQPRLFLSKNSERNVYYHTSRFKYIHTQALWAGKSAKKIITYITKQCVYYTDKEGEK